jgi:hypothetical protein
MLTVMRRLLLFQLRGRMPHQAVSDLPGVAFTSRQIICSRMFTVIARDLRDY